jgi:hypothetical protein
VRAVPWARPSTSPRIQAMRQSRQARTFAGPVVAHHLTDDPGATPDGGQPATAAT